MGSGGKGKWGGDVNRCLSTLRERILLSGRAHVCEIGVWDILGGILRRLIGGARWFREHGCATLVGSEIGRVQHVYARHG